METSVEDLIRYEEFLDTVTFGSFQSRFINYFYLEFPEEAIGMSCQNTYLNLQFWSDNERRMLNETFIPFTGHINNDTFTTKDCRLNLTRSKMYQEFVAQFASEFPFYS